MRIEVTENNIRIDIYLTKNTSFSRTKIQKLIRDGNILVNNCSVSSSYKVKEKDIIEILDGGEEVIDTIPEKPPYSSTTMAI